MWKEIVMKGIIVRSLREGERTRFFEFAGSLPDRDFWGKKGFFLRGDFGRFQKFFSIHNKTLNQRFIKIIINQYAFLLALK